MTRVHKEAHHWYRGQKKDSMILQMSLTIYQQQQDTPDNAIDSNPMWVVVSDVSVLWSMDAEALVSPFDTDRDNKMVMEQSKASRQRDARQVALFFPSQPTSIWAEVE
jgi:hypothetical protein